MKEDKIIEVIKDKFVWKWNFTLVLFCNALYVFLFYLLMQHYT